MFEVTPFSEEHFCDKYLKGAVIFISSCEAHLLTKNDLVFNLDQTPGMILASNRTDYIVGYQDIFYNHSIPLVTVHGMNMLNRSIDPRVPALLGKPVLKVKVDPQMHVLGLFLLYKVSPKVEFKTIRFQGDVLTYEEHTAIQVGLGGTAQALEDLLDGNREQYWIENTVRKGEILSRVAASSIPSLKSSMEAIINSLGL